MPFAVEEPLGGRALAGVKGGAREEAEALGAVVPEVLLFRGISRVGAPEEAR